MLDLLDAIREKIMVPFDKKRRIVKKWKGLMVPTSQNYLNKISKARTILDSIMLIMMFEYKFNCIFFIYKIFKVVTIELK